MLEHINSIYFRKIIFSFLEEKTKLKVIKYNKTIQNLININLLNYKISSSRYIFYETNSKGKEYNILGKLIYEGEYLNGKKNGKGKEYYYNELIFEGEYKNGKRNGKGK